MRVHDFKPFVAEHVDHNVLELDTVKRQSCYNVPFQQPPNQHRYKLVHQYRCQNITGTERSLAQDQHRYKLVFTTLFGL